MAPNGPHHHDTNSASQSATQPGTDVQTFTGEKGDKTHYIVHDGGRAGITVWPADAPKERRLLPAIEGVHQKGDGVIYRLGTSWGTPLFVTSDEIKNGLAFAKLGDFEASRWRGSHPYRCIWEKVAGEMPVQSPSPRISQGYPPLGPALSPRQPDEATARISWATMADRLTPTGRWVVGLLLTSPWVDQVKAAPSVISLWGEAGEGKSLLAQVCASLFGDNDSCDTGLFNTFDSSPQGLRQLSTDLSYYPLILDEAQSATASVESTLRALVMRSKRTMGNRTNSNVKVDTQWQGIVLVTGNDPIPVGGHVAGKSHEMFRRRLIEIQAHELWAGVPPKTDRPARREFWSSLVRYHLPVMDGWPWHALCRIYTPGTTHTEALVSAIDDVVPPTTGDENLGKLCQLATVGAQFLAEWTGSATWTEGVEQAGADLLAEQESSMPTPARDAATDIIDDLVTNPGAWTLASEFDAHGFPADDLHHAVCGCNHEGTCEWMNIYSKKFAEIVETPLARLGGTEFRKALYTTRGRDLTRTVKRLASGVRPRAVTVCIEALVEISTPKQAVQQEMETSVSRELPKPEPAEQLPEQQSFPEGDPDPFQKVAAAAEVSSGTVSIPVTVDEDEDDLPELDDPEVRVFDWTDSTDVAAALDAAVDAGVTDLVVPTGWPVKDATRWDMRKWRPTGASGRVLRDDRVGLRLWSWDKRRVSPKDYYTALTTFRDETHYKNFVSIPTLGQIIVREHGSGRDGNAVKKQPLWQLEGRNDYLVPITETWREEDILSIKYWGDSSAKDDPDVVSYDRNKAYLPSLTQARVAPLYYGSEYEHYGAEAPVKKELAGLYKIVFPDWDSPLPPPHGDFESGSTGWVSHELMKLYAEIGTPVQVIEAWLGEATEGRSIAQINHLSKTCKRWLQEFDDPTRMIPKKIYTSFAGSLRSEKFSEKRLRRRRIYRPDWAAAIEQNSWCNFLRDLYAAYEADNRFVPLYVNVDAVKYPGGLPTPPGFVIGDGLGQYKIEG